MNIDQLTQGLLQAFEQEQHRLVFWYDPSGDFKDELDGLNLPAVNILNMQGESALAIKLKLEHEDTQGKYLLYFPSAEPDINQDWLLDIKLYSRCFYADRISIIFNDLGLQQRAMHGHLQQRERFLSSKARVTALKKWLHPEADERAIDMAMLAVVLKADGCDLAHIIFALAEEAVAADLDIQANLAIVDELEKYGLVATLAAVFKAELGYESSPEAHRQAQNQSGAALDTTSDTPVAASLNIGNLLIRLLTTEFCERIGELPDWAPPLVLKSLNGRATADALLSRWRDSSRYYKTYDAVSGWVAHALRMDEKIQSLSAEQLAIVATFEQAERHIMVELVQAIPDADAKQLVAYSNLISRRLDGYWASRHKDDDKRRKYRQAYQALLAAINLFELRRSHAEGFHYKTLASLYKAYESDLYRVDMAYRHYWVGSLAVKMELFKSLDQSVEHCYANWYIDNLAKNWGDNLESENRLANWQLDGVTNQQAFYQEHIAPALAGSKTKRLVVLISDAFRYEAAVELAERINEKRYSAATLSSQLGVVPSYTTLGMASLLPHASLEYRPGVSDDVFVDGRSSKGTASRNKILAAHGGIAVTAENIKQWSREEGREALRDQQLVYVYHNVVDARGDSASTESETFMAVDYAINELNDLIKKIMMHFNTTTVVVTADHGFLFQQSKLEQADRTSIADKPANTLKTKKRYVIGHELGTPATAQDVWSGSTRDTAGTASDTEFWIPRGANRFHFVGGARFVHGGAMPQEVVVPVITVKQLRGANADARTKKKVGVISRKSVLKMVNNTQKFDLMQTEAVSEQMLPVTIAVAIYEGQKMVSSEHIITFDGATDSALERNKAAQLSLSGDKFDRKKDYFLVLKDKDLQVELERYPVTIDLAFTDDFF